MRTLNLRMKHIEHVGIAVRDLGSSVRIYERLLNTLCYKTETVESAGVRTAFFQTGESKIELLESLTNDGVIARFIENRGEGLHHIAFEVEDLEAEMKRLENDGFVLLNRLPEAGADNKLVCFVHPKETAGVLIELCMNRV